MSGYNISFITMHCLLTLLQGLIIVMPYQQQNNTKQHYSMLRLKYLEISIIYNLKYLEHDCSNNCKLAYYQAKSIFMKHTMQSKFPFSCRNGENLITITYNITMSQKDDRKKMITVLFLSSCCNVC